MSKKLLILTSLVLTVNILASHSMEPDSMEPSNTWKNWAIEKAHNYKSEVATQLSSLSILPFWFPFYTNSLKLRAEVINSPTPSNSLKFGFNQYKGITLNLPIQLLYPAVYGGIRIITETAEETLHREVNPLEKLGITSFVGGLTTVLTNPYETILIEAQKYKVGPLTATKNIIGIAGYMEPYQGFKALYRGASLMALRNAIFANALFLGTPAVAGWIEHNYPEHCLKVGGANVTATTLGAIIPATLATTGMVGIDLAMVLRQSDAYKKAFSSGYEALRKAYKKHGIRVLKAGFGSRLVATWIEIAGFNILQPMLANWMEGEDRA